MIFFFDCDVSIPPSPPPILNPPHTVVVPPLTECLRPPPQTFPLFSLWPPPPLSLRYVSLENFVEGRQRLDNKKKETHALQRTRNTTQQHTTTVLLTSPSSCIPGGAPKLRAKKNTTPPPQQKHPPHLCTLPLHSLTHAHNVLCPFHCPNQGCAVTQYKSRAGVLIFCGSSPLPLSLSHSCPTNLPHPPFVACVCLSPPC